MVKENGVRDDHEENGKGVDREKMLKLFEYKDWEYKDACLRAEI